MQPFKKVFDFIRDVKVELSKVVWPTPAETIRLTMIVIVVTIGVGFFLGVIDLGLTKLLALVLNK